jgi:uncharacterized caspase-like protein
MPAGRITNNRVRIRNIYGLFIGIDGYPDPGIGQLKGCVRDATQLSLAFDPPNKKRLLNEEATRKNILGAVQNYVQEMKIRDLLIFSVSSHGTIINSDLALLPYDAERENLLGTVLSTHFLLNALSTIAKNGGKVLFLLDACHAGAMSFDIGKYGGILSEGGISCLYSSGPNEVSYESQFTGDGGEKIRQGVFTKHLLDGLKGNADLDGLRIITLRDLYDYVYRQVSREFHQHPVLVGTLEGNTILKTLA